MEGSQTRLLIELYLEALKSFRDELPLICFLALAALWLGMLAAGAYSPGDNLIEFAGRFCQALERPFSIRWTSRTPLFMVGAEALAFGGVLPFGMKMTLWAVL